jgi:hypothetical protein
MGWLTKSTPLSLNPRERPGIRGTGNWVGPMAGWDWCRKSHPNRDFGPSRLWQVGLQTNDSKTQQ